MAQRLSGQNTFISIISNNVLQTKINSIKDCEVTFYLNLTEDDFLGETGPRFDMFYKGSGIKLTGHLDDPQIFTLQQTILQRARRELGPGTRFDMGTTFRFDSGIIASFVFSDLQFADLPLTTGARDEFTEWTLDAKCTNVTYIG